MALLLALAVVAVLTVVEVAPGGDVGALLSILVVVLDVEIFFGVNTALLGSAVGAGIVAVLLVVGLFVVLFVGLAFGLFLVTLLFALAIVPVLAVVEVAPGGDVGTLLGIFIVVLNVKVLLGVLATLLRSAVGAGIVAILVQVFGSFSVAVLIVGGLALVFLVGSLAIVLLFVTLLFALAIAGLVGTRSLRSAVGAGIVAILGIATGFITIIVSRVLVFEFRLFVRNL